MKRILIAASAVLMLASCAKEMQILDKPIDGTLQTINVNIVPFNCDDATKTAVTHAGDFTWSAGDQIGIYPLEVAEEQTSQQITFKVQSGDASSTTFTGTGWGLITTGAYSYFAYYPYSSETTHGQTTVNYSNNLTQESNDTTSVDCTKHLGVNDFLYAPAITPTTTEDAAFTFHHLSALVEFKIKVPDVAKEKTFRKVEILAGEPLFTTTGTYNPSTTTSVSAPVITTKESTSKLILLLDDLQPDKKNVIHAYFLMAPAAVGGKDLTVRLVCTDNKVYIGHKSPSSDIVSNDHRKFNVDVDIDPNTSAVDLNESGETANCYIVSESGRYRFLANVRGNGSDPIKDAEGPAINTTGCYAEVLWESVNTDIAPTEASLISSAQFINDSIIFFASGIEGNALISLKSSNDSIVWSWHIWITGANLEALAQTYPNDAGVFMDRNLGALSATPGDPLTMGMIYQWGRPFPLVGYSSFSKTSDRVATTNSSLWTVEKSSSTTGTFGYSAANPTVAISPGDTYGNWYYGANPLLWSTTNKTMYDPCPIGWRVPSKTALWETAGFSNTSAFKWTTHGRTFSSPAAYYPINGCFDSGVYYQSYELTRGYYWSADTYGYYSKVMRMVGDAVYIGDSFGRNSAYAVRPCKE